MTNHFNFSLLIPLAIMLACGSDSNDTREAAPATPVRTALVESRSLTATDAYTGTVEATQRLQLSTKIMAWIKDIYFAEGDRAKRGEKLVQLRSEDLEAKHDQAVAATEEARIHYETVETNLQRIEALFAENAATQKELDDMRAAFATAKARKVAADEGLREIEELLRYTSLRAPFDGIVTKKHLRPGDLAGPGQFILGFESLGAQKVVVSVPESDILSLKVGMPVTVEVGAVHEGTNGSAFDAKISRIVRSGDPATRQFEVQVDIAADAAVLPGMFARIITGDRKSSTLMVPQAAIIRRGQLQGVFVVTDSSTVLLRWIRLGKRSAGMVEVLSGLSDGERVAITELSTLRDGSKVEVMP